ncbi:response regulator [Cnuella takakiae]|nr:response regulator [Cnuella takakiae]
MTILWAEDNMEQLETIRSCVKELAPEATLYVTNNGSELINTLLDLEFMGARPDMIILDLNMPVVDGRNTLATVKADERFKHIPSAIFTSSTAPMDRMFSRFYKTPLFLKSSEKEKCLDGVKRLLEWYWTQKGKKQIC